MEIKCCGLEKVDKIEVKKSISVAKPSFYENTAITNGTATQGAQECHLDCEDHRISALFQGYFNNKMTLLVFLVHVKSSNGKLLHSACGFLDDMYRHMLARELQGRYRLVFVWLRKFFLKCPNVSVAQRDKALGFIGTLYDVFGIRF